ncbi:MAG: M24 family metallopeptidase, partial [Candidatus Sumerlaeota bacterium]
MAKNQRADFDRRIGRLQASVAKQNLDAMLVMTGVHRFYLTGFRSTMGLLIVEPDDRPRLLVDARYHEMARKEIPEVRAERITQPGEALARLAEKRKWKRVGFEGQISTRELAMLQKAAPNVEQWQDAGGLIEDLRVVKSRSEQAILRRAEHLGDAVFQKTIAEVRPGMSEWDIRRILRRWIDEMDAEGESFDCIVSAGNNSSKPHAHVTDR